MAISGGEGSAGCCEEEFGKGEGADQGGVEEPTGGGSGHVGDKVAPRGGALHGHGELKDFDGAAHQEGDEEDPEGHLQRLALQGVDEKEGQDKVHAEVDHLVKMGNSVEFLHGEVLRGHEAESGNDPQPEDGLPEEEEDMEQRLHPAKIRENQRMSTMRLRRPLKEFTGAGAVTPESLLSQRVRAMPTEPATLK